MAKPQTADGRNIVEGMRLYPPSGRPLICTGIETAEGLSATALVSDLVVWVKYETAPEGSASIFKAWLPSLYADPELAKQHRMMTNDPHTT